MLLASQRRRQQSVSKNAGLCDRLCVTLNQIGRTMTIHPHLCSKNKWVLGRNRVEVAPARFGDRQRLYTFDAYWSGSKWVRGTRFAMTFETETHSLEYLERNIDRMEGIGLQLTAINR